MRRLATLFGFCLLASCGGGSSSGSGGSVTPVITPMYSLGGSIAGLDSGTGLTLVNGTETLPIGANTTAFTFATKLVQNASYSITVGSQPVGMNCSIANGSGTIAKADVSTAVVTCGYRPIVSTLAGTGKSGFVNGIGTAASFNNSSSVAADISGNVFVADADNHVIRKITPAGVVSTLAGTGAPGFVNGLGTAASFFQPIGVAVDSSGNVFVADRYNHAIRKITPAGVVTTIAGTGTPGFFNGTGTAASFNSPIRVAVDSSGTVYVADDRNSAIRKITPAGVVSTLAGTGTQGFVDGTSNVARFKYLGGVALDSSGNVFVADFGNHAIRKITPAGIVSTLAGTGTEGFFNGIGIAASFGGPADVAVDSSGNVLVADAVNSAIRKITPAGVVSTLAGTGRMGFVNGTGTAASFSFPTGVAVDSSGNLFVADALNNAIRKIVP